MERSSSQTQLKSNLIHNKSQQKSLSTKRLESKKYGVTFLRYILQMFNIMFFISGCCITAVALWSIFWKHQYISLLVNAVYPLVSYGLLISGVLTTGTALFGCYVAWRDQRSLLCCYSLLLLMVFALEFLVGAVTYVYEPQVDDELLVTLNNTFITSYGVDSTRTNAIDLMQQNYKCCGAERFEDWKYSIWFKSHDMSHMIRSNENRVVPDSCCISYSEMCGKSDHPSNIPQDAFIDSLMTFATS